MSKRDAKVTLREMLDFIEQAREISSGKRFEDLTVDVAFTRAAERLIELLGEAANRIPEELRSTAPAVPWASIIGMRNRLIHGYHAVDYQVVWNVLQNDLEPLERGVNELLRRLESGGL